MPAGRSESHATPSRKRVLLYWLNSLNVPAALLVNDITDLCNKDNCGDVLGDVILEVVNTSTSAGANGGRKVDLSSLDGASNPEDRLRLALRLLGQRVGWKNLTPGLSDHGVSNRIFQGDYELLVKLLEDLRRIGLGPDGPSSQSRSRTNTSRKPKKNPNRSIASVMRSTPSAPEAAVPASLAAPVSENAAALSADGISDLSNNELELARTRVARMLAAAEQSLEEQEERAKAGAIEQDSDYTERFARFPKQDQGSSHVGSMKNTRCTTESKGRREEKGNESAFRAPIDKSLNQQPWVPPEGGWNMSTASVKVASSANVGKHAPSIAEKNSGSSKDGRHREPTSSMNLARRVGRDRRGLHQPAAKSFHNREFQQGRNRVDKNGLFTQGMWDPTFAPSLRRLTQLGFSPSRQRRHDRRATDSTSSHVSENRNRLAPASTMSGHASTMEASEDDDAISAGKKNSQMYVPRSERRTTSFKSGMEAWKKELRTPSRKKKSSIGRKSSRLSPDHLYSDDAGYLQEREDDESNASIDSRSRTPLFKGPKDHSHALSPKQKSILRWMRQLGIEPLPQKKEKELTGSLVASAFADGVQLCYLVAALEARAGGRGAIVRPTSDGKLTLQGANLSARTTAACTSNINTVLKVLRHRKNMNTRHLWAAKKIRNGDAATVWELLSDIEHEYSANHVMHVRKIKKNKQKQTRMNQNGRTMTSARKINSRLEENEENSSYPQTPGAKNPSDTGLNSAANHPGSTLRRRTARKSSMGLLSAGLHRRHEINSKAMTAQKPFGLLDPTSAEGLSGAEHNPYLMSTASNTFASSGGQVRRHSPNFKSPMRRRNRHRSKKSRHDDREAHPNDVITGPSVLVFPKSQRRPHSGKTRETRNKNSFVSGEFVFQNVSTLQEEALRKWLQQMGFEVPTPGTSASSSSVSIVDDPLRNGTLLVALVQMLDPDHGRSVLSRVHRNPISTRQAIKNVQSALQVLRSRRYSAIPAPYLHQPESIVKGKRAVLWGLLWHLKRTIETFVPDPTEFHQIAGQTPGGKAILKQSSDQRNKNTISRVKKKKRHVSFFDQTSSGVSSASVKDVSTNLEGSTFREFYTPQESWQLERSLLSWLFSIGVFTKCHPPFDAGVPRDLSDIEASLRNGTLLCVTAEEVTTDRVRGWMKRPKTDSVARRNVEKALELLRVTDGMSQRFTWKGDEIHKGSRHDILGIFEDMHRYQDGLAPRPKFLHNAMAIGVSGGGMFNSKPYFGSHVPSSDDMELPDASFAYPGFKTPSSYLVGRTISRRQNNDVSEPADLNSDQIGKALQSSRASSDARLDQSLIMQSSSSQISRQGRRYEISRGIRSINQDVIDGSADPQSQAQAFSAIAASRTIPLVPDQQQNSDRSKQYNQIPQQFEESFFSNGGLVAAGESFHASSSPRNRSGQASVSTMFNSPSNNDKQNHESASTVEGHAAATISNDIYPSSTARLSPYSSYHIPDSNPRISRSNIDISAVNMSMGGSPSTRWHLGAQNRKQSANSMAQAVLENVALRGRDASNDIVPLPSSIQIPGGSFSASSSVIPEHSPQSVIEANSRHNDIMRSLRKMRRAARSKFGSGGLTGAGNNANILAKWIRERLNIPLDRPRDLDSNIAPEFSNGVKLCQIVQRCELMRGAIPGVNPEPKNKAQCLQNIRAALELLGDKASMPVEHLFSEDIILKGETFVIVPLLLQIRKAYGHHLGAPQKKN